MNQGDRVEVRLHNDPNWYAGVVVRPRKMEVQLGKNLPTSQWNTDDGGMLADESDIAEWRYVAITQKELVNP